MELNGECPIRSKDSTRDGGLGSRHVERDTNRWAQQTFGECELGDERRTHRLVDLASRLSSNIGEAPSSACRGDVAANEGAYDVLYRGLNCWIPAFIRLCESPVNSTSG